MSRGLRPMPKYRTCPDPSQISEQPVEPELPYQAARAPFANGLVLRS